MYKSTIAVASLLAGSAAASTAAHVQRNGAAFTSEPPSASWTPNAFARSYDPLQPSYVEIDVPADAPAAEEPVFLLKRASKRSASKARLGSMRRAATLAPCSSWRDIGVKAVAGPAGTETRYVRDLCK